MKNISYSDRENSKRVVANLGCICIAIPNFGPRINPIPFKKSLHNSKLPFMFWWKSSVKWNTKWLGLINSYRPPNSITFQFEELFSLHSQIAEQTNAFFLVLTFISQKVSLNDACLSKKKIFYDILHIACKKIQVGIYKYMYQC